MLPDSSKTVSDKTRTVQGQTMMQLSIHFPGRLDAVINL